MVEESKQLAEKLLASLPDNILDRLAELIALKLMAKNDGIVPSKQVVAGSNPASRSTKLNKSPAAKMNASRRTA